jgi:hypothetical protein
VTLLLPRDTYLLLFLWLMLGFGGDFDWTPTSIGQQRF